MNPPSPHPPQKKYNKKTHERQRGESDKKLTCIFFTTSSYYEGKIRLLQLNYFAFNNAKLLATASIVDLNYYKV